MELRHLRYFIAVAEHQSVRLAAEHVHVTQPAISRQIHDLEAELGFALFVRSPRGLKLTPAGQSYLQDARRALALLDGAASEGRRIAAGLSGRLRLGFVENSGWDGLVPRLFRAFQAISPDLRLDLVPLNSPEQLAAIRGGSLDGGLVYLYETPGPEFATWPILERNVVLAVPRAWDLPAEGPVEIGRMAGRPFVCFSRAVYPAYYDRLIGACRERGVTLDVVQEEATESAILSLVCAGIGAAIVNSANRDRPPAQVRFLELADLSIPMPLAFACRTGEDSPVLRRFLAALKEAVG